MSNARDLSKQGNNPAFSVAQNGTQTIGAGAFTKVQLNTKVFDTNTAFDATTNYRFTPQVAGYYQISAVLVTNQTNAGLFPEIRKNGTRVVFGSSTPYVSGIGTSSAISYLIYLNGSTDYVEFFAYHNATGTVTLTSDTQMSGFLARGA